MRWRTAFWLSVVVWALMCTYCLWRGLQRTVEEPETFVVPAVETTVIETVTVEEDEPELVKLPQIVNATLTHYCLCEACCGKTPDHPAYGITASGRAAEPYLSVAVDPYMIPLGSTVYIDYGDGDLKEYRADDTGSAVTGAKIDLCVSSHEEALQLGIKTVKVWWSE